MTNSLTTITKYSDCSEKIRSEKDCSKRPHV